MTDLNQLWKSVQDSLSQLQTKRTASKNNLAQLDALHSAMESKADISTIKSKALRLKQNAIESTNQEEKVTKDTLTIVTKLIEALENESKPPPNKKTRHDTSKDDHSTPSTPNANRTSSVQPGTPENTKLRESRSSTPSTTRSSAAAANAASRAKAKGRSVNDQLPLKPGRPVAYRQNTAPGSDETGWIQCRVVETIGGDKNKYRVQDVEAPEGKEGEPGMIMSTTIKSLIPMPDPRDKSTYPDYDFPSGADVLALFPETTSFYRGNVAGPSFMRGKTKVYRVVFEDDDGIERPVESSDITEYPH